MNQLELNICTWELDNDEYMPNTYNGSCGIVWTLTEGNCKDNECNFCPKCGCKINEPTRTE